ncbi:hypothetical protein Droror1_Dr00027619, partial [Drosera rotundifolia]
MESCPGRFQKATARPTHGKVLHSSCPAQVKNSLSATHDGWGLMPGIPFVVWHGEGRSGGGEGRGYSSRRKRREERCWWPGKREAAELASEGSHGGCRRGEGRRRSSVRWLTRSKG